MDIYRVLQLYDNAASLVADALYQTLEEMPDQCYEFEHGIKTICTDKFTDEVCRVAVNEVFITNEETIGVRYSYDGNDSCECALNDLEDNAAYLFLQAMDYEQKPVPQVITIEGHENVEAYLENQELYADPDEFRKFASKIKDSVTVYQPKSLKERIAYLDGMDVATDKEIVLVINDDGEYDIKLN